VNESDLPRIDLTTLFLSISTAALMGLGVAPPGAHEAPEVNLALAKQNIDLLDLLREKTRGNRTPDEDRLLEQLLYETRMLYVQVRERNEKDGTGAKE